jgi:Pvc16 N-terminal domain
VSSYLVISSTSDALRDILWSDFSTDPVIQPIVGTSSAIVFTNPTETARDSANRLSLWLYQVAENEFVKNRPPLRGNGADTLRPPPMALDLSYLVTPFAPSGEANHLLLGKTMQVFYDHASPLLLQPANGVAEQLRIVFARLSLEELTRIWEALREPYRLSVGYRVRVTTIESLRTDVSAPVTQRVLDERLGVAR